MMTVAGTIGRTEYQTAPETASWSADMTTLARMRASTPPTTCSTRLGSVTQQARIAVYGRAAIDVHAGGSEKAAISSRRRRRMKSPRQTSSKDPLRQYGSKKSPMGTTTPPAEDRAFRPSKGYSPRSRPISPPSFRNE